MMGLTWCAEDDCAALVDMVGARMDEHCRPVCDDHDRRAALRCARRRIEWAREAREDGDREHAAQCLAAAAAWRRQLATT